MKYFTIPSGPFEVNTYLIYDDENNERLGFIIDPGGQENKIDKLIKENNINLQFILNTHCHIDHVAMVNYFKKKYGIPLYANEDEQPIVDNLKEQAEYLGFDIAENITIDKKLKENEDINIGNINIKSIFTPGHSPGSTSFLVNNNFLFSGDTLFRQTIGRTDLFGGDFDKIIESIKNKLFKLDDDIIVHPGHGKDTAIGYEKKNNAYLM
ncbi:MAG: MBL fold metallo-hydrolase [Deltaproteobacteria bacterium]|nr:MBL fold metallo-hydrolase [Deltaproteobacteria bacterium]